MANPHTASPNKVVATVTELVSPITQEHRLMLWDVRFVKEGATWILRVVIDRDEEPVSINDCVTVSRQLSALLDEVDPIPQSYCLEVTSPGADRELTRPEHFAYYEGYPVEVKLYRATDNGQKEIAGLLEGYVDGNLTLRLEDDSLCTFEKKAIAAVHAIDEWDENDDE